MWIRLATGTMVNLSQAQAIQIDSCGEEGCITDQYALNAIFTVRESGDTVSICIGIGTHPEMCERAKVLANALVVQSFE